VAERLVGNSPALPTADQDHGSHGGLLQLMACGATYGANFVNNSLKKLQINLAAWSWSYASVA
jgi:hypothetical protein